MRYSINQLKEEVENLAKMLNWILSSKKSRSRCVELTSVKQLRLRWGNAAKAQERGSFQGKGIGRDDGGTKERDEK